MSERVQALLLVPDEARGLGRSLGQPAYIGDDNALHFSGNVFDLVIVRFYNRRVELKIFTDGSCQPNPGEMAIGVVCLEQHQVIHRISRQYGPGTSNVAELLAIKEALSWAPRDRQITLCVDSKYAEGLISMGWNPTKNLDLVEQVRDLFRSFPNIKMVRVKGHNGITGNVMADKLCHSARLV